MGKEFEEKIIECNRPSIFIAEKSHFSTLDRSPSAGPRLGFHVDFIKT
jgi:hypothetical protein